VPLYTSSTPADERGAGAGEGSKTGDCRCGRGARAEGGTRRRRVDCVSIGQERGWLRRGRKGSSLVYRAEYGAAASVFQIITSGCGNGGGGGGGGGAGGGGVGVGAGDGAVAAAAAATSAASAAAGGGDDVSGSMGDDASSGGDGGGGSGGGFPWQPQYLQSPTN
jgi:hypothetical protein